MEIKVGDDGFIAMLRGINGGAVIDELDRELMAGVQAIFDNGGKSDITLKINLSRIKNMDQAVDIKHDVIAKHPREPRSSKAMFATRTHGLTDQFQDQQKLELTPSDPRRSSITPLNKGEAS